MEIKKKTNELEIHFDDKVVKLRGHQDDDAFSLFTESLETCGSMSNEDKENFLQELKKRKDVVIR